jgi:general secretion pathway protein A
MCRQIGTVIGAEKTGLFPHLVRNIDEQLKASFDGGLRPVVIFDDAHELRSETLKLVRLLTNFDMDSRLIVSMILVGHANLKEILLRPEMADVRQRLVHCGEIRPLTREETRSYIDHRVKIAGASQNPFDPLAVEALFEVTRGNMRELDRLAGASLAVADKAGRSRVEASDVACARAGLWM